MLGQRPEAGTDHGCQLGVSVRIVRGEGAHCSPGAPGLVNQGDQAQEFRSDLEGLGAQHEANVPPIYAHFFAVAVAGTKV